jgi:hypothetical protein
MGLISSKFCSYEQDVKENIETEALKTQKGSGKTPFTEQSDNDSICSHENKTKVKFSNVVYQRVYFNTESENDLDKGKWQDEHKFNPEQVQEDITVISFEEESLHRFIIEDGFFKLKYNLPKTENDEKIFKTTATGSEMTVENKTRVISVIKDMIEFCYGNKVKRIDGIAYNHMNSSVVIMTEVFLLEFLIQIDKFSLIRSIKIESIDYITFSSDGRRMILHLMNRIPSSLGETNDFRLDDNREYSSISYTEKIGGIMNTNITDSSIVDDNTKKNTVINKNIGEETDLERMSLDSKNYFWEDFNLERIIACLASTYFLNFTYSSRFLYVIIINPNFEIFDSLLSIKDFNIYKETLNSFLTNKLKEVKDLNIDFNNFKYSGVKYKVKGEDSYKLADFIITFDKLALLSFRNNKFEMIREINTNEIETVIPNSKSKLFAIHTKKEIIKIKTISYNSIAFLLDKIYKRLIDRP